MLFVTLLVIPTLILENSTVSHDWKLAAGVVNALIWLAFVAELVVMLRVVPDPKRWLRDHPLDIAIVVLTPPFLPSSLQSARLFRLLRVVRLVRIVQLSRRIFSLEGIRAPAVLSLAVVLVGGTAFAAVESTRQHKVSAWDGIWWAMQTVTTVGYGTPEVTTNAGRVIAMAVMLTGIGFVALLTAAAAQRFIVRAVREAEAQVAGEEADLLYEIR
jgi:voltage-gated potassium channel